MAANEYTPQEAFELLMNTLRGRDDQLASHIQSVVDAGKDVNEIEPVGGRRGKNTRSYRRTVPYEYEEALQVALGALQAYFVEQPLFIDSCAQNMAATQIATSQPFRSRWFTDKDYPEEHAAESDGLPKKMEIELRTETQISEAHEDMFELRTIDATQIESQRKNIAKLEELFNFEG